MADPRQPLFKTFQQAVRTDDFVITAQLPLAPMTNADDIRQTVDTLRPYVDALQISDNVTTEPHMSPLAAAGLVLQCRMDAVVQFNCRDRNRIALQSDIMGAGAIGVTSLVLSRGEKFPAAFKQKVKGVFDIGAKRLLATAQVIGAVDRLVPPPGFLLGSNITVIDPPDGWTADGVDTKAGAGSKFVQTQPCLHVPVLRKYTAALVAKKALQRISVIVQIPVLDSMDSARELQRGRRALLVPKGTIRRLEESADFARAAQASCSEVLREIATIPGISGANLLYRGDPQTVAGIIRTSGLRAGLQATGD